MVLVLSISLKVRPTKMELIKLRRRLVTSIRVRRILSERLTILVNEFMATLKEALVKRQVIQNQMLDVYRSAEVLLGIYGSNISRYLMASTPRPEIYIATENIMGVKVKTIITKYPDVPHPVGLEEFSRISRDLVSTILDLARLEQSLHELGKEIAITKRKSNALEYIIIPRLRETIKYLQLKFDEREREEKSRFKRIKQILTRRTMYE